MPLPTPPAVILEPFGNSALPADILVPIPTAAQPAGRASFDTGFSPPNFLAPTLGGVPPAGADFNGLFYMITDYLANMQAGQYPQYNSAASTAFGGYAIGAILAKADGTGLWVSTAAANVTDPDTGGSGWASIVPAGAAPTGVVAAVPATGTTNDYAPTGLGVTTLFLDLSPAGAAILTGIKAGFNGQRLIVSNLTANALTLSALNTGSAAANRLRMAGDIGLGQNNSVAFTYSTSLALWVQA